MPDRREDLRISAAPGGSVKEWYENPGQRKGERRLCRQLDVYRHLINEMTWRRDACVTCMTQNTYVKRSEWRKRSPVDEEHSWRTSLNYWRAWEEKKKGRNRSFVSGKKGSSVSGKRWEVETPSGNATGWITKQYRNLWTRIWRSESVGWRDLWKSPCSPTVLKQNFSTTDKVSNEFV